MRGLGQPEVDDFDDVCFRYEDVLVGRQKEGSACGC